MNIQERYNRLTSKQKAQFSRLRRPSMETGWKKLTDEEILNMIERDAKPKVDNSKFARIANRPKVLRKTENDYMSEWMDIIKKKPKSDRAKALDRAKKKGLRSLNRAQRLSNGSGKSHHVMAYEDGKGKYIRFGQAGVKTNQTAGQRRAFKSRHAKNIKRGKMSAAYWANKVKW